MGIIGDTSAWCKPNQLCFFSLITMVRRRLCLLGIYSRQRDLAPVCLTTHPSVTVDTYIGYLNHSLGQTFFITCLARFVSACASRIWNNLPSHLRTLPELEFKKQLKTHLFGECYGEVGALSVVDHGKAPYMNV